MKRIILLSLSILLFFTTSACADQSSGSDDKKSNLDLQLEQFYNEAAQAIDAGDNQRADFFLARYMGKTLFNEMTDKSITDLYPLFQNQDLAPTSLLFNTYDRNFIEWFVFTPAFYWQNDNAVRGDMPYAFLIASADNGDYYVTISAYPYIEAWSVADKNTEYSTAFLALGSFQYKPFISSGAIVNGKSSKQFRRVDMDIADRPLQHIWKPEFYDLDNDGVPEIWLRYNLGWATGFSQELAIYKIIDDKLILFKKFEGAAEGIARRLDDGTIEVAEGFSSDASAGHAGYDQHHFETFEYKNGEFMKVSEKNIPHILHSQAWKDYYLSE